jgi:putative tricarboxylic transport membrane protein
MTNQPNGRGEQSVEPEGSTLPTVHRPDLYVAGIVLAICGLLFLRTFWFDTVPSSLAQNVQPTLFPRLVLIAIAIITLILPFEYAQKKQNGIDLDAERRDRPMPIVYITAGALILFVGVMPWLGTYAGLAIIAAVMPLMWGERRWKILVPYVLLFPTALIWLFAEVLQVTFVPGIVGHLFQ